MYAINISYIKLLICKFNLHERIPNNVQCVGVRVSIMWRGGMDVGVEVWVEGVRGLVVKNGTIAQWNEMML